MFFMLLDWMLLKELQVINYLKFMRKKLQSSLIESVQLCVDMQQPFFEQNFKTHDILTKILN